MNRFLLTIGLGILTVWDMATTVYGTITLLGQNTIQWIISILWAFMLSGFLLRTIPIIKNPSQELVPSGAKVLWFLAILYDLFTAFTGNFDIVLGNVGGTQRIIFAIGLTIFICSGPIGLSQIIYKAEER
ncbi:MAG: hypothetical protein ACTHNW_00025 [Mucilaginibacter sp.]